MTHHSPFTDLDARASLANSIFDQTRAIESEVALRRIIPGYPKILDKRIQTSLDYLSLEFISVSTLAILATHLADGVMLPIQPNDLTTEGDQCIRLGHQPSNRIRLADNLPCTASLYFMVSGLGHGLRVNGRMEKAQNNTCIFLIEQVYFHCGRAAARSALWSAQSNAAIAEANFLEHCSFLLLKTRNQMGRTELSPRGDEAGFVKQISENTLLLPERPGNKVAVSLRNILLNPEIQLLCFVPGTHKILTISGSAKVIGDENLLRLCTINNKVPKTGVLLRVTHRHFETSKALDNAVLWQQPGSENAPQITSFSKALSAHINGTGLLGKVTSKIVGAVVKHDMNNLY